MKEKIENIEKVFVVVRRRSRKVKPDIFYGLDDMKIKFLTIFSSRRQAQKYIDYWNKGRDLFDIVERKLK